MSVTAILQQLLLTAEVVRVLRPTLFSEHVCCALLNAVHRCARGSCYNRATAYRYRIAEVSVRRPVRCGQFGIKPRSRSPTAFWLGVHIDGVRFRWCDDRLLADHDSLSTNRHGSTETNAPFRATSGQFRSLSHRLPAARWPNEYVGCSRADIVSRGGIVKRPDDHGVAADGGRASEQVT